MKIGGREVTRAEEVLVLPRPQSDDIVIRARSVAINDEFEALCPMPIPPSVRTKNGKREDLEDESYLKAVERRDNLRWDYMILRSLEPSEIEWETVDLDKPNTWSGWKKELLDAGLSDIEIGRIQAAVMSACSLDEDKLKEARDSFLLGQDQ